MSEQQLRKHQEELAAYQEELQMLQNSQTPQDASKEILAFIQKGQDPFNSHDNEWTGGGTEGCCLVM